MIRKLYMTEIKRYCFYIEIDEFYVATEIFTEIENDRKYTVTFEFRSQMYNMETCDKRFWDNEEDLKSFISIMINEICVSKYSK